MAASRPRKSQQPRAAREVKVAGVNACLALFNKRPQDIIRVYLTEERTRQFGALLKWCAANRKAYRVIPDEELARVTESTHHEGICILARQRAGRTVPELVKSLGSGPACLVALEDVQNPHNVGAIIRVCAHFGVPAVLCLGQTPSEPSTSVYRTSEGGAEHVELVEVRDAVSAFRALREAGFRVLATSQRGDVTLYQDPLPARTVVLFGSEATGLTARTVKQADALVRIPGSGCVESLNVACASTAVLAEWWRVRRG